MTTVTLWCTEPSVRQELQICIARGASRFTSISEWEMFEKLVGSADCSVLVPTRPLEHRVVTLLQTMMRKSPESVAATHPVVVVGTDVLLQTVGSVRDFGHVVISRSDVQAEFLDAIPSEVARAALAFLEREVENAEINERVRAALFLILGKEMVPSVGQVAQKARIGEATLHHRWVQDGIRRATNQSLKGFMDLAFLLKSRARKLKLLTWEDVAAECGTSTQHLATTCLGDSLAVGDRTSTSPGSDWRSSLVAWTGATRPRPLDSDIFLKCATGIALVPGALGN